MSTKILDDVKVNVRIKLSALWVTVMLCYIYGDFFSFFVPGHIETLNEGNMGIGPTTPFKLLMVSILMTIPAIMVFLSVALKPAISRWINIIFGSIYTVIMIATILTTIDPWWIFYIFLGIIEMVITSLIVWYAWTWPKQ